MPRELAWIIPVGEFDPGRPDNTLPGGRPGRPDNTLPPVGGQLPGNGDVIAPPIQLPPAPPNQVVPPIVIPPPPEVIGNPIVIPGTPENPIALPPGTVWPPLNPGDGVGGSVLVLIWIVGTDKYRWVSLNLPEINPGPTPK